MVSLFFTYTQLFVALVWGVVFCSVLDLLWWWSLQQLARLTESYNVGYSPLRKDEAPAVHSFPSFLPSLPSSIPPSLLQVLWAPLGSHPSLSHTGPIIGAACKLVGLQMGRACRTYLVSATQTKTTKQKKKKTLKKNVVIRVWTSQCLLSVCKINEGR